MKSCYLHEYKSKSSRNDGDSGCLNKKEKKTKTCQRTSSEREIGFKEYGSEQDDENEEDEEKYEKEEGTKEETEM